MTKRQFIFLLGLILLLSVSISPKEIYADTLNIQYEDDNRVKPIKNADTLTEPQLDKVLDAIGIDNELVENISTEEKIDLASQGGKTIVINKIGEIKTFYKSLDGSKIEYNSDNQEIIYKKKLEDLATYNKVTGDSLTLEDFQPIKQSNDITTLAALPNNGFNVKNSGKLELAQQVIYLGSTSTQYRYTYISNANWNGKPLNTKTDVLASAWDNGAVATANTFTGQWWQDKLIADGKGGTTGIYEEKKLSMLGAQPYGQYTRIKLGDGDFQGINMTREVRVAKSKKGHPAYTVTKYFHTYYDLGTSISVTIGPASINIPDDWTSAGDETYVEYSYTYGDY